MIIKICLLLLFSTFCHGKRLHEDIYSPISGAAACFRRLNGTHQTGCSSADGGAVGVVHFVATINDAQWMVHHGKAGPYVAVTTTSLFNDVIELLLDKQENVAGILLYENITQTTHSFSQESQCPNEYSSAAGSQCSASMSGGTVWNPQGTGLLRRDIPFPIFYLSLSGISEINKIQDCYLRFNAFSQDEQVGRPLCSVQLNSFMFAAVSSELCLRRSNNPMNLTPVRICDPLGNKNVYSQLFPRTKENEPLLEPNRSVVLVTTRIDSTSLFEGFSPGAASSVVGLVTLLTAASTLSKMFPKSDQQKYQRNVMWAIFTGESFDYIGSQRVAWELSQGLWPPLAPLATHSIDLHVELGQLGGGLPMDTDGSWKFTAFSPSYGQVLDDEIKEFVQTIGEEEPKLDIALRVTNNLPPSSLHSFRRILGNSSAYGGLQELVLADHTDTFTNKFYHSVLDDKRNVDFLYRNLTVDGNGTFMSTKELISKGVMTDNTMQVKVARLATALAKALYKRVTGVKYTGNVDGSAHMVDELLHCYLESRSCRMIEAAEHGPIEGSDQNEAFINEIPEEPLPLYVGVWRWSAGAPITAAYLLVLLTGEVTAQNETQCKAPSDEKEYLFYWLAGWNKTGVCVQSIVNYSDALSPAFVIPEYDFSSGVYSTWTESVWRDLNARVFVASGGGGARAAAALGAVATALAVLLAFWLRRHADLIFLRPTTASTIAIHADPSTAGILRTVNC